MEGTTNLKIIFPSHAQYIPSDEIVSTLAVANCMILNRATTVLFMSS